MAGVFDVSFGEEGLNLPPPIQPMHPSTAEMEAESMMMFAPPPRPKRPPPRSRTRTAASETTSTTSSQMSKQSMNTSGRRASQNMVSATKDPAVAAEDLQSGAQLQAERQAKKYTEHIYDASTLAMWTQMLRDEFRNGDAMEQAYRIYASRPMNNDNIKSQKMTIREKTGLGQWMQGRLVPSSYIYNVFLYNVDLDDMMMQLLEIKNALDQLKLGPLPQLTTDASMSTTYLALFEQNMARIREYLKKEKLANKTAVRAAYEQVLACTARSGQHADILECLGAFGNSVDAIPDFSEPQRDTVTAMLTNAALSIIQAINTGGMQLERESARALTDRLRL